MKFKIYSLCILALFASGCSSQSSSVAGTECPRANQTSKDGKYVCDAVTFTWVNVAQPMKTDGLGLNQQTAEQGTALPKSRGNLFNGKCEANQQWLADLEFALSVQNWQAVYSLTSHLLAEDFWGLSSDSAIFTFEQEAEWGVGMGFIARSVIEGNYSNTRALYAKMLPLMSTMDLACSVVTGKAGLRSTILP